MEDVRRSETEMNRQLKGSIYKKRLRVIGSVLPHLIYYNLLVILVCVYYRFPLVSG